MARTTSDGPRSIVGGGRLSCEERVARGRAARTALPREMQARWEPAPDRPDPISLLESQNLSRVPELVPIRHGRMAASPFAFFRGAAVVMAEDLASTPTTGIKAQLCGDAHLSNFGGFASPERTLLFDVNDFDETLPGPWEWDLKRLAASFLIASRGNGFSEEQGRAAVKTAVRAYASHMRAYADEGDLDVWYSHVTADDLVELLPGAKAKRAVQRGVAKARSRDNLQALSKLTTVVDGRPRIVDDPPLLVREDVNELVENVEDVFRAYRRTLQDDRRQLLERFELVDVARKVVGVGSVGTRCLVVLLVGKGDDDPLFLQIKEAEASVLERRLPKSRFRNHAQRVVAGQRLMQAASDIFLGWIRGEGGRDFYWRQLRDMKASIHVESLTPGMRVYAEVCGWALARAHARSGDRIAIAAYIGNGGRLGRALADFAVTYADRNERDHASMLAAIKEGRIAAETGI
jgi:uncharacterized protein (DUF2252 family)